MIEAMKQALEALEYPLNTSNEGFDVDMAELLSHRAITSLYQAIAEAEKVEPVAWVSSVAEAGDKGVRVRWVGGFPQIGDRLYTSLKVEQEPVVGTKTWFEDGKVVTQNLYASDVYKDPPQRQWVGLTDDEYKTIHNKNYNYEELAYAIEAKLKEKNT